MADNNERKTPPGRKGGTKFPHIGLQKAVEYSKRLVSKTHTAAQPATIILAGVFDSSGARGGIRASALKQFGLLKGTADAYEATDLGKSLVSAPQDENAPLLRTACLKPAVFKVLYDTFRGDKVSIAKIKQQALKLEVHPESGDECVKLFVESIVFSGLAKQDQDQIEVLGHDQSTSETNSQDPNLNGDSDQALSKWQPPETASKIVQPTENNAGESRSNDGETQVLPSTILTKSPVQLNLDVDSTMDPEKLEKLLRLLKSYGAL